MDDKRNNGRPASDGNSGRRFHLEHQHFIAFVLILYDVVAVNLAFLIALWLRFDCRFSAIPAHYLNKFYHFAPYYTVFCILTFYFLRLYRSVWRFASFREL